MAVLQCIACHAKMDSSGGSGSCTSGRTDKHDCGIQDAVVRGSAAGGVD
jgi:hypothetical protein